MKLKFTLACLFFLSTSFLRAQYWTQYFDGADTSSWFSLFVEIDTTYTNNIWQIGHPQKIIFNNASTVPNVIVTDTINNYPINDTSRFSFAMVPPFSFGIMALQWLQKLDFDHDSDGGIIEYSTDHGAIWHNAFNDPYVYNFYGYQPENADTIGSGEYAFSGTDTNWRNIWLCFDYSFMSLTDTFYFRFTSISDSVDNNKEGWMIDNFYTGITGVHTVKQEEQADYLKIYPTPTKGVINIEAQKLMQFHIIERMELLNTDGKVIRTYGKSPTKFYIDISDLPNGMYYLKVQTNIKSETFPLILNKD